MKLAIIALMRQTGNINLQNIPGNGLKCIKVEPLYKVFYNKLYSSIYFRMLLSRKL